MIVAAKPMRSIQNEILSKQVIQYMHDFIVIYWRCIQDRVKYTIDDECQVYFVTYELSNREHVNLLSVYMDEDGDIQTSFTYPTCLWIDHDIDFPF